MPIPTWADKTCGTCGFVSPNDLNKYTCSCGHVGCTACMGDWCDADGNTPKCRVCQMKKMGEYVSRIRMPRPQV